MDHNKGIERFFKLHSFRLNKKKFKFSKPVSTRASFLIWKKIHFEADNFFETDFKS